MLCDITRFNSYTVDYQYQVNNTYYVLDLSNERHSKKDKVNQPYLCGLKIVGDL